MCRWHEKWVAKIGLRLAGLALLASAWAEGGLLRTFPDEASVSQCLLAGLLFLSTSIGMALALIGAGLWQRIPVSDRWARRPVR